MEQTTPRRRIVLLDTLRGIAMIYMIFYHIMFDLLYMFGVNVPKFLVRLMDVSVFFTASFVFLAGITVRFSRSAATRGARLMLIAAGFTFVTAFIFPGSAIYFGVLHLLSTGMLIYGAFSKWLDRLPWPVGLALCAAIFAATYSTSSGYIGFGERFSLEIPSILQTNNLLYQFGFVNGRFASADYLPVLPWLFLFFCGVYAGRPVCEKTLPEPVYRDWCPPVTWLGRNSLIIYIVHQPLFYGLLYLIFEIILKE